MLICIKRRADFRGRVNTAGRKAGGDTNRIGGSSGKGSGRFNARGRGAKVVVKARVVKLNSQQRSRGP